MCESDIQEMTVNELSAENIEMILPDVYQVVFNKGKAEGRREADLAFKRAEKKREESSQDTFRSQILDEKKARLMTDKQLKEHFERTQDLKDQFSSAEAYIAAIRHSK